jgi:4-aminobutyrate aminotransferase-like enzyme
MKERGVLLSIDGPLHNVLKIKPPLVFDSTDCDELTSKLDDTLSESFLLRAGR